MALVSKKKDALGKGIRALLSDIDDDNEILKISATDDDSIVNTVPKIKLDLIEVNPFQPRADFNQQALEELSSSIKVHGVIQPITVRKIGDKKYQLISGERRLRASQMAGLEEIPAYVRTANDQEVVEMALIENIQREDLNAIEVALTYQRLIDECELTHENLGDRLGKDRSTVTNYLRLLKLPPEIQKALRDKVLSMGHARAIISVPEVDKQLYVLKEVNSKGLSVRKTEELVRLLSSSNVKKAEKKEPSLPVAYKSVQSKLMDIFETKVKIKKSATDKGEIVIPFYSVSDLNRLLDIIEKE
ncbi:MAG TPA: ParB/RepB/Spo0J family partition protein [Chitinophagales bacterium]|jgi:ParB family chromosome partitioning protein|nr:ParB/RepB/Spo0J family partition protein [Chitinophagales bacterium]MBP6154669.1 ParB/RepB/Spo0J family partition protein [Chitinophagales bacterium]HQV77488.1 ParB/RepB/Spo0J family partition protein [Chitinophagales bacterium]HQW78550.1 ParB/RepB/Spo0J family partition protein [Chitinophagales bacterium]HRB19239.1 ParB/RepB/Spo0J family partition protein [Chitinophagales bacterium]